MPGHDKLYEAVIFYHDGRGNQFNNVFHFGVTESGSQMGWYYAKALCDAIDTAWVSWGALVGNDVYFDFITARRINPSPSPRALKNISWPGHSPIPNEQSGDASQAVVVSWIPSDNNKHVGRTFFGGIPREQIGQSKVEDAYQQRVQTLADIMRQALVDEGSLINALMVVRHKLTSTFSEIGGASINTKVGTQVKRLQPVF